MKLLKNLKRRRTTTISYKIYVHTLPESLENPLREAQQYLQDTQRIYQFVIESNLFWRIWMIDEYEQKWIEVEFQNAEGNDEFHTLVIEEGTYRKVTTERYQVLRN